MKKTATGRSRYEYRPCCYRRDLRPNPCASRPDMSERNRPLKVDSLEQHRAFLKREAAILKTKLQPSGSGNIHTAISVIEWRIDEIDHELSEK